MAVLSAAVFLIFLIPAHAQEAGVQTSAPISEESILLGDAPLQEIGAGGASAWIVFRMVIILALAALAIYGVVFFIKRLARPPQAKDPNLKLLASIPLAGDTYAAVISVGAKAWLVGGGSGAGVRLISEITEPEALETMLLDDARRTAESGTGRFPDFRSLLNRFGKNSANDPAQNMNFDSRLDSVRKQQERLRRLK